VTFERWMGDGTFTSAREQLECVPLSQVLVYKMAGVIHCPDILWHACGHSHESSSLHPFAVFQTFVLAPTRVFLSHPPSSPAGNSCKLQPSSSSMCLVDFCHPSGCPDCLALGPISWKRQAPQDPVPSKQAHKSSPFQGHSIFICYQYINLMVTYSLDMMGRGVDIIDLISDDDLPKAGAVLKSKRKAHTSNLGDIVEFSD
jgi:hypothetical protein